MGAGDEKFEIFAVLGWDEKSGFYDFLEFSSFCGDEKIEILRDFRRFVVDEKIEILRFS